MFAKILATGANRKSDEDYKDMLNVANSISINIGNLENGNMDIESKTVYNMNEE